MKKSTLLFLLPLCFLFTDCGLFKQKSWLKNHRAELETAAKSSLSEEEKLDILLINYVKLMDEGLRFANPKKGVKFIQKYQKQNGAAINSIVGGGQNWASNLNAVQKIGLATRVAGKPWLKDFIRLAPKFKRRYEQYKFIMDMTGQVSRGFGNIGGKVLGL